MPRRFSLLIFDWDGTLMDSAACIAASLQSACADLELQVPSEREARYVIGLGLHDALAHVAPALDAHDYPRLVERYRHHFLQRDSGTVLFHGAAEMLKDLRESGHLLAVATGKSRQGLNRALSATGLAGMFQATRCADEGHSKPHPGMLYEILGQLNVPADRALMIGDTTHDMQMARAAGMARLGIGHGAHDAADLLAFEPVACVRDCAELRAWLSANA